ncbi:MAG: ABC transporter ATP-binding protein [Caulobacteraceae bacterium]
MTQVPQPLEPSDRALMARVARVYLAPRWKGLVAATFFAAIVAGFTAALAAILEPATNRMIVNPEVEALWQIPLIIAVLAIVRGLAQVLQAVITNRIGHGIVGDIQAELFGKLLRADLARLRAGHSGEIVASVLYDAGLIREAAASGLISYLGQGMILVASLGVMLWKDWLLTLIALVAAPLADFIMRNYVRRTTSAARDAMAETSSLSTAVMESLDGIRVVKIENREAYEQGRVADVIDRRQAHIVRGANAKASAAPTTDTLTTLIVAGVLAYAGWRALGGHANPGSFFAFLTALTIGSQSLRQLANVQTVVGEGLAAARRLFQQLDIEAKITDAAGAIPLPDGEGRVRFEAVSFAYEDGQPVLADVTLEVGRGETVALVGPSGGGKSTILNLIPRFYDVGAGRVTIDGRDVRDLTLASLRGHIALVTQEPFLFDDTIAANIAYSRPEASQAEIEEAARQAAAHDFIAALPRGYDTPVGEAGTRLSGGQRQRIAIARAFLKNAPILLLDEATSALDTESEAQVQAALARLMAGRATVLIAHRLSTVKNADRIYVLEGGRIVETGVHADLTRQGGLYARLARTQDLETA